MAVPGNVTSELSRGTHWLIKNGAKLVETWEDVAEELPSPFRENLLSLGKEEKGSNGRDGLEPRAKKVYELLKIDTLTQIDEIVETTEFSVAEILSILLDLELRGLVIQCPGKHYQRRM
jgi:DNA processing protein